MRLGLSWWSQSHEPINSFLEGFAYTGSFCFLEGFARRRWITYRIPARLAGICVGGRASREPSKETGGR